MEQENYFLASDIHSEELDKDLKIFKNYIGTPTYYGPRIKAFSTMLSSAAVFLYDHPEALKIYPNGFYSENAAFIPVSMYTRMKDNEPLAFTSTSSNSYWNLSGIIFISFLTKMIEQKYNMQFNEVEKGIILNSAFEHTFDSRNHLLSKIHALIDENNLENPSKNDLKTHSLFNENDYIEIWKHISLEQEPIFLPNEKIALLAKQIGINETSIKFINNLTNDSNFIDYALLKNGDIYEKEHPFFKLIEKIKLPIKNIDLLNLDKDTYKEKIKNIPITQSYVLYNAFEILSYHLIKDIQSFDDLARHVSGIWSNLALETNDSQFETILNILYEQCVEKFPDEKISFILNKQLATKLAKGICNNEKCQCSHTVVDIFTQESYREPTIRTISFPSNKLSKKM